MNQSLSGEITAATEVLEVNKFAQRARHLRIFSKGELVRQHLLDLGKWAGRPVNRLKESVAYKKAAVLVLKTHQFLLDLMPVSPQRSVMFKSSVLALSALLVTSLAPDAPIGSAYMTYSDDYIDAYSINGDILVSDDDGYLVKINPQTNKASRIGMTDYAVHTVDSGESLSVIAEKYGVSVKTIMWENNLYNANSLRIGQKLLVPPVDGISYKVASSDNLDKIAKKYKIEKDAIIAQNALSSETLKVGQALFLPGAEPIVPVSTVGSTTRAGASTRDLRNYSNSNATPALGKIFIFPTNGKITQGYKKGHYALDIGNRSKPPIWAAAEGTVVKASSGTYGGGYGNHVIIDHGDGVQTLYAHMSSVGVEVGDTVSQGDVIGVMGNTGRVYGVTGIHLHWECMINGVKEYCGNYY